MKKVILVIITMSVFFFAYSQTEQEIAAAFVPDADTPVMENKYAPLLDVTLKMTFKEDFVSYNTIRKRLKPSNYPLLFKHKKSIYLKDQVAFLDAYVSIKSDMIYYRDLDVNYYANDIQYLALRMLRFQFLPDNSANTLAETQFLLDILIESGAVDLDVLADAYAKVQHLLTPQQRIDYTAYLKQLYLTGKKFIADNFERLKKGYETSTGEERKSYLYAGKHLERTAQAMRYANDLLALDVEQKN